jgi:hypothetical protein
MQFYIVLQYGMMQQCITNRHIALLSSTEVVAHDNELSAA